MHGSSSLENKQNLSSTQISYYSYLFRSLLDCLKVWISTEWVENVKFSISDYDNNLEVFLICLVLYNN
jgi:hypothetical protein